MPIPLAIPIAMAAAGGAASLYGSMSGNKDAKGYLEKGTKGALEANDKYRQQLEGLYGSSKADADKAAAGMMEVASGYAPIDSSKYAAGAAALNPGMFAGNADVAKDPGYQFRMGEAQKALEAQQAKAGTAKSGFAEKEMAKYMQGLASQEYQNAYNRDLSTYNTQLGAQNQAFNQGMQLYGADIGQSQFGANLNMNALSQLYGGANANMGNYAAGLGNAAKNDMQTIMSKYSTLASNAVGNNPFSALGKSLMGGAAGMFGK